VIRDVGKYMDSCDIYQRMKNQTEALAGKLKLSEVSEKLETYLMVYFITKLLLVVGKDMILIEYNRLSKMTYFIATTERISVEDLIRLLRDNIWKLYRLPESVMLSTKNLVVIVQECGQTWTKVRVKYYNY